MLQLTHADSPLAQSQKHAPVRIDKSSKQLSQEDQATLRSILDDKYDCIHHELFELPEAQAQQEIFEEAPEIPLPDTSWYHPVMDSFTDTRANNNVGSVLLTAKQEQALFIQFNYCRHRVNEYKTALLEQDPMKPQDVQACLHWHRKADILRRQIADTNLALVLAMAKRSRLNEMDFADLVSEGNMALLRAVDKFDASRGFKFSTYACRAILKAFSRNGMKFTKYRQMFPAEFDPTFEKSNFGEMRRQEHEQDCAEEVRDILTANRAELSDIEQEVIEHRFAIGKPEDQQRPLTLEEVGKIIGVTKERVRQIQNKALVKLKSALEDDFLD